MIRKISPAQAERMKQQGAKASKKLTPSRDRADKASLKVADSIDSMVNQMASMFAQHLTRFDMVVNELREENKVLKAGQAELRDEIAALRNRSVRLKPVYRDGDIQHIDVVSIQKKSHRQLN
jgi:FtsZ-binding cell division protein ZapB